MISVNSLRQNTVFTQNGNLLQVLEFSHIKMARGGAVIKTKVKNLETGTITEISFKNTESVEDTSVNRRKVQFLYSDEIASFFMDQENFEQFEVPLAKIGDAKKFLKEGMMVTILLFDEKVINIELPIKEVYEVTQTAPGLKGDTVSGGSKPATVETGAIINVPLFIKIGDKIRVNTLEGKYVERAN